MSPTLFQSTLPRREWLFPFSLVFHILAFQSTLPRREWLSFLFKKACFTYFNPHSHKGSDWLQASTNAEYLHFNPHSHKGSDRRCPDCASKAKAISIHTPTKGVTPSAQTTSKRYVFQSTLPQREWRVWQVSISQTDRISIHTPTKGVTGWKI